MFAFESGWRQRGEWNGEWSGVSAGVQGRFWTVRQGNSGLTGSNVTSIHERVDSSNGVLAVADVLFLAAAASGADSFQGPGEADLLAGMLGDFHLVALGHG